MLEELKSLKRPIRVGLTGMGAMGKGLFYQCRITPGFDCIAIADVHVQRAVDCAEWLGRPFRVVENLDQAHDAVRQGLVAVSEDGGIPARLESADAFIEASNSMLPAFRFAEAAVEHGKHLILMNSEVDLMFGPLLASAARRGGVVYTSCDGDQHGVLKRLADDVRLWGFELVMAGNIKGFLDRAATPESIVPEADKRRLDYRMATAYTDGSKLAVEMALLANGIGLSVRVPGMTGPRIDRVSDVFKAFDFHSLWRDRLPFVDYILGAEPGGGVFVVGASDNEYQRFMMSYYKMGDGPFYLFYRPYHLCHVESMACVADAVLHGRFLLAPEHGFRALVTAYAKRALRKGETLDGLGGFTCYGLIEACPEQDSDPGLPVCLADDLRLARDIPIHGRIRMADVRGVEGRADFAAFRLALEGVTEDAGMRLGIVAVYTGGPGETPLLDLHLRQIERTTGVPYTVFAGAKRLAPENGRLAGRHPNVILSDCPASRIRGTEEHAIALESLIRLAVDGGSTHVCVLHMDSFPVRPGWAARLHGLLERGAAFVSVERIGTSCLFFSRDFYLRYRPVLLMSGEERTDPVFSGYVREIKPLDHSGIGYGFKAYQKGLRWHSLPLSQAEEFCGELYGGLIFHLGGAVRIGRGTARITGGAAYVRALASVSRAARKLAGERRWREGMGKIQWTRLAALKEILVERPRLAHARRHLIENPEAFLRDLLKSAEAETGDRRIRTIQ